MDPHDGIIKALIELHRGIERQGPGDEAFSRQILSMLPKLPEDPRIADFGCGAGAGALILAEYFQVKVTAVDFSAPFLTDLKARAKARGLDHLIRTVEADMGALDWPAASLDLLWSEGAAYNLTFEGALKTWRSLMTTGGVSVISEITWFEEDIPAELMQYWQTMYPQIAGETENAKRASTAGYEVLGIHRLPSQAWWSNYYHPLLERMDDVKPSADSAMQEVIAETEVEIDLFRRYSDYYGYAFYLLKAV
jgi:serine/threonine-protein kinase HipA